MDAGAPREAGRGRLAVIVAAIVAGACGGVVPTAATASPDVMGPTAIAVATASPSDHDAPMPTPEPRPVATPEPRPVATPDRPPVASPSPVPSVAATANPSLERTQPVPSTDACERTETYVVVHGDTLSGIAARYGLSLAALIRANPQIRDANLIITGQHISVPVMTDLGTLGGTDIRVSGINDRGDIVGSSHVATNVYHAVRWHAGAMTDLGTLGGLLSQASDINDRGQVVGASTAKPDPSAPWRAVLWQDGHVTDLGTLGGPSSMATVLNGRGAVVGISTLANGTGRGFIWANGAMRDLGTLGGVIATVPTAINDRGQVVGAAYTSGGEQHAFLWKAGSMRDLGTLGGTWSFAYDINERGQVVGVSSLKGGFEGPQHAFVWQNGVMTDLGALADGNSGASAINETGQIAGWGSPPDGTPQRPQLWTGGHITDLRIDGEREGTAVDLNDRGQVIGTCLMRFDHAFVLQLRPGFGVSLATPAANAAVAQNDPSTGCPASATRGSGVRLTFAWDVRLLQEVSRYTLVAQRTGASMPWVRATITSGHRYALVDCSFVTVTNLSAWQWRVTAYNHAGEAVAVSEWRPFHFAPCRLADGSPCSAPG